MGAGKSSIARLVDYCLGGTIQLSPALQAEFVSATLIVELERATVSIERARDAADVFASWKDDQGPYSIVTPARVAAGEVIPETGVETLSNLVFWLSKINSSRVRRSRAKSDSNISSLSMRDLLWYCYLDQDHVDSLFFCLEESAEFYMRLKSRDVTRYVIGYHDERVADLEAELEQLRANRTARVALIDSLSKALTEVGIESEAQVVEREIGLRAAIVNLNAELETPRMRLREAQTSHALNELAKVARGLRSDIAKLNLDAEELRPVRDRHVRHRNEIDMLGLKFKRSAEARKILGDVAFSACPRAVGQSARELLQKAHDHEITRLSPLKVQRRRRGLEGQKGSCRPTYYITPVELTGGTFVGGVDWRKPSTKLSISRL